MLSLSKFILASFLILAFNVFAQAQEATKYNFPSMTLKGSATLEFPPDFAKVTFNITTKAATLEEALKLHQPKKEKAMKEFEALNKLETQLLKSSFYTSQSRQGVAGDPTKKAEETYFAVNNTFELKILDMKALNSVLTKLINTNDLEISHAQYGLNNLRPRLLETRKLSVKDASEQAKAYAEAANTSLVEIFTIVDLDSRPEPEGLADLPRANPARKITVTIIPPAFLSLTSNVEITWKIKSMN
jgi:uncharacterized protein